MTRTPAIYRALLLCYPAAFRQEYGQEMSLMFSDQLREARDPFSKAGVWVQAAADLLSVAPKEHFHVILQDIRYTLRTLAASPGFAAVAILSLALGIGANTALFSLWNGVLKSALPVTKPEQLVMLSDPNAAGVSIGSQRGVRALFTYEEFQQLRDRTNSFSALMASQSSLERWQIRIGSNWEEATGRLVSGEYFDVLGVAPKLGRTFTPGDDKAGIPVAVISHKYWMNRFGGRPGVIGSRVNIRKAAIEIIGVTPPGFLGETSGEQPDLWVPMSMQPGVLPGRDWLHDRGPDKVMWLHVFGRLKPGVGIQQAQAQANSIFHSGLEAFYGANLSAAVRKEFLDQKLEIRAAPGGASSLRERFNDPLNVLLAAVGVLLFIACTNLANLLLARGAARQREIALRLSLGASRVRLVRQLLTESMVLAVFGGVLGLAMAYFVQRGLVLLIAQAAEGFQMNFDLEPRVLAFTFAITCIAAVTFGLLPAWLATRTDSAESLKGQGRTTTAGGGQMRWGRILVALQLALSLPLLVGAALLLRTLNNLQNADLGFAKENLIVVRIDAQTAGYELHRREPLFRNLLDQFKAIPGVTAASFSENGLFGGSESGDQIEVEGYTAKGKDDRGSRWDQVGPRYFTTLGVPLLMGRDITENDRAGSPKVCVINESFAKKFFSGRNPIGMHITTIFGDQRNVHEIVGVAKNFRTHRLRGDVPPRNFVPLTQPLGEYSGIVFSIRTAREPGPVLAAIRKTIQQTDGTIPILFAQSMADRLDTRMAQDRIVSRLTIAFGLVAMLLAAIGLYGVQSYGVARRRSEIGIRIALGAIPARVTRMIVRESLLIVVAGLLGGAALAYAAGKFIASQLYGLSPTDPPTLVAATVVLILVALSAAYIPARRASRLDPMVALRQD